MILLGILLLRARLTQRWMGQHGAALGFDSADTRGQRFSARYSLGDSPSTSGPGLAPGLFLGRTAACSVLAAPSEGLSAAPTVRRHRPTSLPATMFLLGSTILGSGTINRWRNALIDDQPAG